MADPTLQERLRRVAEGDTTAAQWELLREAANALDAKDAEIARLRATVERVEKLCDAADFDAVSFTAPGFAKRKEFADEIRAALTETKGASDK